jgi:hypothetical protein
MAVPARQKRLQTYLSSTKYQYAIIARNQSAAAGVDRVRGAMAGTQLGTPKDRVPLAQRCLSLTFKVFPVKPTYLFATALLALLTGCAVNPAGSTGAVFHTSSGQHITAATAPEYRNGRYEFIDVAGAQQSLYLTQITSVSR